MSYLSSKLSELYNFSWVEPRWNLHLAGFSNLKISLSFWDFDPIFGMWAQFLYRSKFYIATRGPTQLLHWFPRGGGASEASPPPTQGFWTPSVVGLISDNLYYPPSQAGPPRNIFLWSCSPPPVCSVSSVKVSLISPAFSITIVGAVALCRNTRNNTGRKPHMLLVARCQICYSIVNSATNRKQLLSTTFTL